MRLLRERRPSSVIANRLSLVQMAFNGLNAPPPDSHIFLNDGEQK